MFYGMYEIILNFTLFCTATISHSKKFTERYEQNFTQGIMEIHLSYLKGNYSKK